MASSPAVVVHLRGSAVAVFAVALLHPACGADAKITHLEIGTGALPFKTTVALRRGDAVRLTLPNGKDLAAWCLKGSALAQMLDNSDYQLEYGERPFAELDRKEPVEGRRQMSELNSYIRQGAVLTWSSGPGHESELYVDRYRITLREEGPTKGRLPVRISVRQATEKELEDLLRGNKLKAHFLPRLKANDPATRVRAMAKLSELCTGGDQENEPERQELIRAVRPLRGDANARVRDTAELVLRGLGDEEAILRFITPRPAVDALAPGAGSSVALWCRPGAAERVAARVLTFFDARDRALQRFAVEFFTDYSYRPAEEKAVKALRKALHDRSPNVRLWAIDVGRTTLAKEIPAVLLQLMDDEDPKVRRKALGEVWHFMESIPTARLTARLKDQDATVRQSAADALFNSHDAAAVSALLESTRDPAPDVRAAAAATLGRLVAGRVYAQLALRGMDNLPPAGVRSARAYGRLIEMLGDASPQVRVGALNGLGSLGDRRAIPAVRKLLDDEKDAYVREIARRVLFGLKSQKDD